jgi:hypothetical protein
VKVEMVLKDVGVREIDAKAWVVLEYSFTHLKTRL